MRRKRKEITDKMIKWIIMNDIGLRCGIRKMKN